MLLIVLLALLGAALGKRMQTSSPQWSGQLDNWSGQLEGWAKAYGRKLCANECTDHFFACKHRPESDKALCGADFADCLGYNPLGADGQMPVVPTACYHGAKGAPRLPRPTMDACARKCFLQFETCRHGPFVNPLACAAHYAGCLGFSPFPPNTNEKIVPPTACSKPPGPTKTLAMDDSCVEDCLAEYYKCKDAAGPVQPTWCAGQVALCLGKAPFDRYTYDPPYACEEIKSK